MDMMMLAWERWRFLARGAAAGAILWLSFIVAAPTALACPVCAAGLPPRSLVQELGEAERVVLARPVPGEPAHFGVVAVLLGRGAPGEVIVEPALASEAAAGSESEAARLLVREPRSREWTTPGAIGVEHIPVLQQLAVLPLAPRSDSERVERLRFFHRYLEHAEPLLARAAHEEIARAPYGAMRTLRPVLDRARLWAWIDDPQRASRRALHYLLIGVAADTADAQRIQDRIDVSWRTHRAQDLGALLVADLELGGESRVEHIERAYLLDADRTPSETQSALLALSVYANEGTAEARTRVIQAYRLLIERRHPLAGFVAIDLARWEHWDAGPALLALLRAGRLHPAASFAIVRYLQASPRPEAHAGLQEVLKQR